MTQKNLSGLLLIITMLMLLVTSCRKSAGRQPDPQPAPATGKLASIRYDDGSYDSIYYNQNGKVQTFKINYTNPGPFTEVYSFEYGADQKLLRITSNTNDRYEYKYIDGVLVSVQHYVGTEKQDYRIYEYTNGRLTGSEEYYQFGPNFPGHELIAERKYTYYADGNLKSEETYSFDPITHVPRNDMNIAYSDYDNKPNPSEEFGNILYFSSVKMTSNNARKVVTKDGNTGTETEFALSYTYNAAGKPLTKKSVQQGGNGQSIIHEIGFSYY